MLRRFRVEAGGEVALLATVQGLVSERESVRVAFDEAKPAAVALGISPEQLAALERYQTGGAEGGGRRAEGGGDDDAEDLFEDLPDHEYLYAVRLKEHGDVGLPPPDLLEAIALARAYGVPVFAVDLTQEEYEDAFTTEVSTFALLRYGRIQRKLAGKPPKAASARAFSLAWDERVRRVKGIARVEARREAAIAERARNLAARHGGVLLLVVEVPREDGVTRALGSS